VLIYTYLPPRSVYKHFSGAGEDGEAGEVFIYTAYPALEKPEKYLCMHLSDTSPSQKKALEHSFKHFSCTGEGHSSIDIHFSGEVFIGLYTSSRRHTAPEKYLYTSPAPEKLEMPEKPEKHLYTPPCCCWIHRDSFKIILDNFNLKPLKGFF